MAGKERKAEGREGAVTILLGAGFQPASCGGGGKNDHEQANLAWHKQDRWAESNFVLYDVEACRHAACFKQPCEPEERPRNHGGFTCHMTGRAYTSNRIA